jgi:hypothetical protein
LGASSSRDWPLHAYLFSGLVKYFGAHDGAIRSHNAEVVSSSLTLATKFRHSLSDGTAEAGDACLETQCDVVLDRLGWSPPEGAVMPARLTNVSDTRFQWRPHSSCSRAGPLQQNSLCLVMPADARHDAEQQNDSRPRMLCLVIGIGTAADTLLEQFSRRKHGV